MSQHDELAVDFSKINDLVKAEVEADVDVDEVNDELASDEDDLDVEDVTGWESEDEGEDGEEEASAEESVKASDGKIKYTANGEEVEIDIEEAKKRLSMYDGSRKAFSEAAKYKKQVEKLEAKAKKAEELQSSWDKLERLKQNPEKLWETITGQKYSEFEDSVAEKRQAYLDASPAERLAIDAENRLRALEKQRELDLQEREREKADSESKMLEAEKAQLNSRAEREFYKHDFPDADKATKAKLQKILWRNSMSDLKEMADKYGEVTNKMVIKAFADNAAVLKGYNKEQVAKSVSQATEKKKSTAKEKAQIAASRNYKQSDIDDVKGMNPLDIFHKLTRRK